MDDFRFGLLLDRSAEGDRLVPSIQQRPESDRTHCRGLRALQANQTRRHLQFAVGWLDIGDENIAGRSMRGEPAATWDRVVAETVQAERKIQCAHPTGLRIWMARDERALVGREKINWPLLMSIKASSIALAACMIVSRPSTTTENPNRRWWPNIRVSQDGDS